MSVFCSFLFADNKILETLICSFFAFVLFRSRDITFTSHYEEEYVR